MSKEPIVVGLDVGTYLTKLAVAKKIREDKPPAVIALGTCLTEGVRRGVVIDLQDATKSIVCALEKASKMIEDPIEEVYVGLNGSNIQCRLSNGKVAVSRVDGEVTQEDIERVKNNANVAPSSVNRQVIDLIPRSYILDEEEGIKNPLGMNGIRLELDAVVVEGNTSTVKNLEKCVEQAGLGIKSKMFAILSQQDVILDKKQKELGVALVDLGAGTTSVAVYEEGYLLHACVIPLGANYITSDIAIGMRTSMEIAEEIKLRYGVAMPLLTKKLREKRIELSKFDKEEEGVFQVEYLASIIEQRLTEIFGMVQRELETIDKAGLLPAGVVLTGGGANMRGVVELAKKCLKLPVKIGIPVGLQGSIADISDPMYASLMGLLSRAFVEDESEEGYLEDMSKGGGKLTEIGEAGGKVVSGIQNWIKNFFPD